VELSIASRVSSSGGALKPSQLDNEPNEDWPNQLWDPPPMSTWRPPDVTHMMNSPRHSLFSLLFHFRVLLSMQTEEYKMG